MIIVVRYEITNVISQVAIDNQKRILRKLFLSSRILARPKYLVG